MKAVSLHLIFQCSLLLGNYLQLFALCVEFFTHKHNLGESLIDDAPVLVALCAVSVQVFLHALEERRVSCFIQEHSFTRSVIRYGLWILGSTNFVLEC